MELVYLPYSSPLEEQQEQQPPWEKNVSQPLLDFLSNLNDMQVYAEVQDEMLICQHLETMRKLFWMSILRMQLT